MDQFTNMDNNISNNEIEVSTLRSHFADVLALESACYQMRRVEDTLKAEIASWRAPVGKAPVYFSSGISDFFTPFLWGFVGAALLYLPSMAFDCAILVVLAFFACFAWGVKIVCRNKKYFRATYDAWIINCRNHDEEAKRMIPILERNIEKNRSALTSTQCLLNHVYDKANIVFPKYRNFAAVAQIYEYLASGRCTELGGPHGAYNLYEAELRQNVIISNLEELNEKMDTLITIQRTICEELKKANQTLSQIKEETAFIAFNTAVIAKNSEISARY